MKSTILTFEQFEQLPDEPGKQELLDVLLPGLVIDPAALLA
jgi:hypothetical protein